MRPWKRAVAVPLLLVLVGAGLAAIWLHQPASVRAGTHLVPPWTPPLRHGGCDSRPNTVLAHQTQASH